MCRLILGLFVLSFAVISSQVWTKKYPSAIIHSVINYVLYSTNVYWESTVCQVCRVIAPFTSTNRSYALLTLGLFWCPQSPSIFVFQSPSQSMKPKEDLHSLKMWPLTPLQELILAHFSSSGLQYYLFDDIYDFLTSAFLYTVRILYELGNFTNTAFCLKRQVTSCHWRQSNMTIYAPRFFLILRYYDSEFPAFM